MIGEPVERGAQPARRRATAVELRRISKTFPGVRALHDVSLAVAPGEVLGLVGENGAGKSTLIKILGGVYPAGSYRGEVVVGGRVHGFRGTADARKAGIAIVHQELSLIPEMSVADNLALGREPAWLGILDRERVQADARSLLTAVIGETDAISIDPDQPVGELGIGTQQLIEIARALATAAKVIVLDEPTAALTDGEIAQLFALIRERRATGASFIYISHRLEEIAELCDRVAVLRDGELVAVKAPSDDLIPSMTGDLRPGVDADLDRARPRAGVTCTSTSTIYPVLSVQNLRVEHPTVPGRAVVDGLSFRVAAGEVVALAGALGSGRTATLSALFGIARAGASGEIQVDGKPVVIRSPIDAIAAGLAFVPEDRKAQGLVLGLSVGDNLALSALGRLSRFGIVDSARAERSALSRLRDLSIKAPSLGAEVATLSGGNQQKIVIGKWLELAPRVLLLDEPTRGVDVGAKAEIYRLIEELVARGHAVVIASSDLPETVRLADRVLVLREGRLVGQLASEAITQLAIMRLAVGTERSAS